jgi:predicted small lipoprotein YifL
MKYLLLIALAACGREVKLEIPAQAKTTTDTTIQDCQSLDGSYTSEDGFQALTIKNCKLRIKFSYPTKMDSYKANIITTNKIAGVAFIDIYDVNESDYSFKIKDNHECTFSNISYLAFKCKNILIQKFYLDK